MTDDGVCGDCRSATITTRDLDNACDALCLVASMETRMCVLRGMILTRRCLRTVVESNPTWKRLKALVESARTPVSVWKEIMTAFNGAIHKGDFVLVWIAARELAKRNYWYYDFYDSAMSACAKTVDGGLCARAWIEAVAKFDLDYAPHTTRTRDARGFADEEMKIGERLARSCPGSREQRRTLMLAIAQSSIVWAIEDWKEALACFFVCEEFEPCLDPLAAYHGMETRRDSRFERRRRVRWRSGMVALPNDRVGENAADFNFPRSRSTVLGFPGSREIVFGLPRSHVWEESTHASNAGSPATRFPTLPHACLRLPNRVTKEENELNPRRATMTVAAAKYALFDLYPRAEPDDSVATLESKSKREAARFDDPLASWGMMVGQFGDVGAMTEYAELMLKTIRELDRAVEIEHNHGVGILRERDLRFDEDADDGFHGEFSKAWLRSLAAGAFATGRPSVVRGFLSAMEWVVPTELREMLKFDGAISTVPNAPFVPVKYQLKVVREGLGTTWSEQRMFSPLVRLLTLAYCDRYIPPDREDVQLLALETLREFVIFAVPAEKMIAVFKELCASLALNCKWTMVRLICRDVLCSSWPLELLPMAGHVDAKRSRKSAFEWMVSCGHEVKTSGTETLRWMLGIVESAFPTRIP